MSHGKNPHSILQTVKYNVAGIANSVERFRTYFLMLILNKTVGELTRESLIELHRLINENLVSVVLNLGR